MTVIQIFEGVTKAGLRPPIPPQAPRVFHEIMPKTWQLNPQDRPEFDYIQNSLASAIQKQDYNPPSSNSPASHYGSALSRPPTNNDPYEENSIIKPSGYGSNLSRPPNPSSPKSAAFSKGNAPAPMYGSGLVRPPAGDDPYEEKTIVKPPSTYQPKSGPTPTYGSGLARPAQAGGEDPYDENSIVKPPSAKAKPSSATYSPGMMRPPTPADDPYGETSVVKPPSAYSMKTSPTPTYGSGLTRPPGQSQDDDPYGEKSITKPPSAYQTKVSAPPTKASPVTGGYNDPYEENTIIKPRSASGMGQGGPQPHRGLAPKAAPKLVMGGNRTVKK